MTKFLVTRGAASAAAVLVSLVEGHPHCLLASGLALYGGMAFLSGPKATLRLLGATLAMAAPLALMHGVINPAYLASHEFLGLPLRAEGFRFAMELSARLALLFGLVGLWLGTPRRTWIALIAASRVPSAWGMAMLQAIALTNVLALRIPRIRQAQRSRGILRDDMGLCARAGAAVAVVVPLIAVTLIDANERGALHQRMGLGSYSLLPVTPLRPPEPLDMALALCVTAGTAALLLV